MSLEHLHGMATPVVADPDDPRDHLWQDVSAAEPLPPAVSPERYRRYVGQTWHQRGQECTGFALAALANYTIRKRLDDPGYPSVSRRMLYEMAQFHDGEAYAEGSTLRGALKGWRRVGVARDDLWPYVPGDEEGVVQGRLTLGRLLDARTRPLLGYARIPQGRIGTMKQALARGHALYACARYHVGWFRLYMPDVPPVIEQRPDDAVKGGHAFVIAGYDERGFWIHNSFGPGWGREGYALLPYADWEANGQDAWIIEADALDHGPRAAETTTSQEEDREALRLMRPHLVVLRDDGQLSSDGPHEMDAGSVGTMLFLFQEHTRSWARRRLAIVADGGYWPTAATIGRLKALRDLLMAHEVYPVFLVWETSWWAQLQDEIAVWMTRLHVPAGGAPGDPAVRQALKRTVLEPLWSKLVERSLDACRADKGGARLLAESVTYKRSQIPFDLHLVSHGVGDHLMSELAGLMPAPVTTATALVPPTTVARFGTTYGPLLQDGRLARMSVFTLAQDAEQADRTGPFEGSLLTLVSQVLSWVGVEAADERGNASARSDGQVQPLLGLASDLEGAAAALAAGENASIEVVHLPRGTHDSLLHDPSVQADILRRMIDRQSPQAPAPSRDPLARAAAQARAQAVAAAEASPPSRPGNT